VAQISTHAADIAALAEGHKQLSKMLEESTGRILDVIEKSVNQTNERLREQQATVQKVSDRQDSDRVSASKPNFQAIGVAFAITTTLLGYYVKSQVGDTRVDLDATKQDVAEVRRQTQTLNDMTIRNDERVSLMLQGKIKIGNP